MLRATPFSSPTDGKGLGTDPTARLPAAVALLALRHDLAKDWAAAAKAEAAAAEAARTVGGGGDRANGGSGGSDDESRQVPTRHQNTDNVHENDLILCKPQAEAALVAEAAAAEAEARGAASALVVVHGRRLAAVSAAAIATATTAAPVGGHPASGGGGSGIWDNAREGLSCAVVSGAMALELCLSLHARCNGRPGNSSSGGGGGEGFGWLWLSDECRVAAAAAARMALTLVALRCAGRLVAPSRAPRIASSSGSSSGSIGGGGGGGSACLSDFGRCLGDPRPLTAVLCSPPALALAAATQSAAAEAGAAGAAAAGLTQGRLQRGRPVSPERIGQQSQQQSIQQQPQQQHSGSGRGPLAEALAGWEFLRFDLDRKVGAEIGDCGFLTCSQSLRSMRIRAAIEISSLILIVCPFFLPLSVLLVLSDLFVPRTLYDLPYVICLFCLSVHVARQRRPSGLCSATGVERSSCAPIAATQRLSVSASSASQAAMQRQRQEPGRCHLTRPRHVSRSERNGRGGSDGRAEGRVRAKDRSSAHLFACCPGRVDSLGAYTHTCDSLPPPPPLSPSQPSLSSSTPWSALAAPTNHRAVSDGDAQAQEQARERAQE